MTDVNRPAGLARLIGETLERNKWTYDKIVQRARERGGNLSRSDITLYRQNKVEMLNPDKILGLALGLGLPPYRVALTFLADRSIDVPADVRTPEAAIHHDHTLSERTREILLRIIEDERRS